MNYGQLLDLLAPEAILALTVLGVLGVDLGVMRRQADSQRRMVAAFFSTAGCFIAIAWILNNPSTSNLPDDLLKGMLVIGPLSQLVKQFLLLLTVCAALLSLETRFTDHVGEYFALLLIATIGLMLMVSTQDILMIFIALELTSLSLYILTGFSKWSLPSAEASLKYFLFGGLSAAFLLFGLSLIYGLTGETRLAQIAAKIPGPGLDPLLMVAMAMVIIGFGFKIAAVPFQLWAPDVYQGAPTPSAALIASGSKVASFFLLAKVMMVGLAGVQGSGEWRSLLAGWVPLLAGMAVLSMALGNLAAMAQSSVKRLLAYSAIAHAGYMLLGVVADNQDGLTALLYYVLTYGLATMGAFGVVTIVSEQAGHDKFSAFAGLSRRAPFLSFCMMVFMLSLAGIPPLAGFFGKFYLFAAVLGSGPHKLGLLWLMVFAIAMSAVSLYYYLQVLKQVYVREPAADAKILPAAFTTQIVIGLLAGGVVLFGCCPNLLLAQLVSAIQASQ
jgi:NADH-quinone oxidoreductase subunit N